MSVAAEPPTSASSRRDETEPAGEVPARATSSSTIRRRRGGTTVLDWVVLALLIPAAGWLCWQSVKLIRADFQMMEARSMVFAWAEGRAAWNIPDWVRARDSMLAALKTTPGNPSIHDQLGVLYTVRARDAWRSPEAQRGYYREAARYQQMSLALRPHHGWTWAALAESLNGIEPASEAAWAAWRNAYAYTPHEPPVQTTLLDVGLRTWRRAPPDVKEKMKAIYASAIPAVRGPADAVAQRLKVVGWR